MRVRWIGRDLDRRGTVLLTGQVAAAALAAAVAIVLARGLGPTAYGRFALISTSVYFMAQVIDVRIFEAAVRFGSEYIATGRPLHARAVLELGLLLNFLGGLVAAGLIMLFSGLIADRLLGAPGLSGSVALYGLVAPLSGLHRASYAILRVLDRFALLATLTAVAAALRLLAAYAVILLAGGLHEALVALLAAETINAIVLTAAALRTVGARLPSALGFVEHARRIRSAWPRMGRFLAASNATGTLQIINTQADVLLVGILASPAAAGALKIARTLTTPVTMLAVPYMQALLPRLMEAVSLQQFERFDRLTLAAGRSLGRIVIPIAAVIAATAPLTVPLLFGPGYGQAPPAILPLAIAAAIGGSLFWLQPAAIVLDLQTTSLRYLTVATLIQIALVLLLVPTLGPAGAGIAALALVISWAALLSPAVARRRRRLERAAGTDPGLP